MMEHQDWIAHGLALLCRARGPRRFDPQGCPGLPLVKNGQLFEYGVGHSCLVLREGGSRLERCPPSRSAPLLCIKDS